MSFWKSLFSKSEENNHPSVNSVSIPHFNWNKTREHDTIKEWVNDEQTTALSINFFSLPPNIPTIKNIDHLRNFYRERIVSANGGLIQVDLVHLDEIPSLKTIFKLPREEGGLLYLASLTIPFHSYSYVIKIQAIEAGVTGLRETIVVDQLLKTNSIDLEKTQNNGWDMDPYLNDFSKGTPMNRSESVEFDKDFPGHPLSLSRKLISQIEQEIELSPILKEIKPFIK